MQGKTTRCGMMRNSTEILKIDTGLIKKVNQILRENYISGKILYVSDEVVDGLYGNIVRQQIKDIGKIKEEFVRSNTIEYAMNIAERIIATDIECILGLGGGRVLDVCKYAAYIAKVPFISIPTKVSSVDFGCFLATSISCFNPSIRPV